MADTLSAQIAESVTEIVSSTIALMPQKAPMMNLVTVKHIPKGFDRIEIPRVNSTSTVQTPTEGDELVLSSQFDLTSTTIQPTKRALMVRVSERATYFSKDDVIALVAEELSQSQAQDIDTDLTAEFANWNSANDLGSTGTDLSVATCRTARRILLANTRANGGPAPAPLYLVITPVAEENLMTDLGLQGTVAEATATGQQFIPTGMSQDLINNYYVGKVVGVPVFRDGYITEDGSGDAIVSMFSKTGLWLAISKDWDMKTFEVPNWIGVIVRSVADYNSGIATFDRYGCQITVDGA